MSNKAQGIVWDRLIEPTRKLVLLKFAECGNDDGESIYPRAHNVYKRCSIGRSTYRKILLEFQRAGILEAVDKGKGGRGKGREWRLNLARIKALYPLVKGLDDAAYVEARKALRGGLSTPCAPEEADEDDGEEFEVVAPDPEAQNSPPGGPFGDDEKGPDDDEKGPPESTKGSTSVDPINPLTESSKKNPCADGAAPGGAPSSPGAPEPERENRHWKPARDHFVKRTSEAVARGWWDPLVALRHDDDGTLVLDAPSAVFVKMVEARYSRTMAWALREAGGQGLRFVVEGLAARIRAARKGEAEKQQSSSRRRG